MSDSRPLLALTLLAVWTVGGLAAPLAHDVSHAEEPAERQARLAHPHGDAAHGDHHHHTDGVAHGTEVQPLCPEQADVELACTLCTSTPTATLASSAAPRQLGRTSDAPLSRNVPASADAAAADARGPPTA